MNNLNDYLFDYKDIYDLLKNKCDEEFLVYKFGYKQYNNITRDYYDFNMYEELSDV